MPENLTERTEQPTPRKLEKAREAGNLPFSDELLSAATLVALAATAVLMGPAFIGWANGLLKEGLSCDYSKFADSRSFDTFMGQKITSAILIMLPFFVALVFASTAVSIIAAGGFNVSAKALVWKLEHLSPAANIKKMFSVDSLVKLLVSTVKIAFIAVIVWLYLRNKTAELSSFRWTWSTDMLPVMGGFILGVVIRLCAGLVVVGLADFVYQKFRYIHNLMMTRQEVKEENKNYEGPPEVKRRIRQKQFEIAMRRMLQDVPGANVVIVNPDHVAVALKYDADKNAAPVVVARGADHVCEKIKEVARSYGVPIIRRPELAREIYSTVKIGHPIPDVLYIAVAEIMALVYRLRQRR